MHGVYRIRVSRAFLLGDAPFNRHTAKYETAPWSLFKQTCKLLAADGLSYSVSIQLDGDRSHIEVRAHGIPKKRKPRKPTLPFDCRPSNVPPIPTAEQCARRRKAAENVVENLRQHMRGRFERYWAPPWRYDYRVLAERHKVLGKWLACRISRKQGLVRCAVTREDYAALDALLGWRVRRLSELDARTRERIDGSISLYVRIELCHARGAPAYWSDPKSRQAMQPFPFDEYSAARVEEEHWREMERLASGGGV